MRLLYPLLAVPTTSLQYPYNIPTTSYSALKSNIPLKLNSTLMSVQCPYNVPTKSLRGPYNVPTKSLRSRDVEAVNFSAASTASASASASIL